MSFVEPADNELIRAVHLAPCDSMMITKTSCEQARFPRLDIAYLVRFLTHMLSCKCPCCSPQGWYICMCSHLCVSFHACVHVYVCFCTLPVCIIISTMSARQNVALSDVCVTCYTQHTYLRHVSRLPLSCQSSELRRSTLKTFWPDRHSHQTCLQNAKPGRSALLRSRPQRSKKCPTIQLRLKPTSKPSNVVGNAGKKGWK